MFVYDVEIAKQIVLMLIVTYGTEKFSRNKIASVRANLGYERDQFWINKDNPYIEYDRDDIDQTMDTPCIKISKEGLKLLKEN